MQQTFRVIGPFFYLQNYPLCYALIMTIINTCFDSHQCNTKNMPGY